MVKCSNLVGESCPCCQNVLIKYGKSQNKQRYYCKNRKKTWLAGYVKQSYLPLINPSIAAHVKEGCGIRSIARLLHISATTVISRIQKIAGLGEIGDFLKSTLSGIAKQLRSPNNQITSVMISVKQIVGVHVTNSEAQEVRRQVNVAINNMIIFLKTQANNKNIKFVNGGVEVMRTDKLPSQVAGSGTTIRFNK
jgi:transposase-like protein